jgi:hypothetical protein
MNIRKVLLMLVLMHALAFLLTACGGKKNSAGPVACVTDQFGNCISGAPILGNANVVNFPFYPNASITDQRGFKNLMLSEFGRYSRCHDYFSADCRGLQVLVQNAGGTNYNVVIRGLAVNPGRNLYFGNSQFNYDIQNRSESVSMPVIAQAFKSGNKTIVRLQKSTYNQNNPYLHAGLEHTTNHVYLETDGLLSQNTLRFVMYYDSGRTGGPVPIASGTLVRGRDIL